MDNEPGVPELETLALEALKQLLLLRCRAQRLLLAYLEGAEQTGAALRDPGWTLQLHEAKEAVKHQAISS